jgi:predicted amidohydrolase
LRSRLTVAALELPHRFGGVDAQLALVDRLLGQVGGAQLAVLPECALTGYVSQAGSYDLRPFAEPLEGRTALALSRLARAHDLALAGPLIEAEGSSTYNSFVVFDRTGARIAHYRKRHPWYAETWATAGAEGTPLFTVAGVLATIAICFDVHFLEADSTPALNQAQLLLFPSAWNNDEPADLRDTRLPQLARAFGVGIVNANWGVGTPRVPGQGDSRIVAASGRELARSSPADGGAIAIAQLSLRPRK